MPGFVLPTRQNPEETASPMNGNATVLSVSGTVRSTSNNWKRDGSGAPGPAPDRKAHCFGASAAAPPVSMRAIIALTSPPEPSPEIAMSGTSLTLFSPRIDASCIAV
jgi:hypothetical protein